MQFLSRHQKMSEEPIEYLHSLQQAAIVAFPSVDVSIREELIRARFTEGLLPGALRQHLLYMPPKSIQDLRTTVLRFVAADKLSNAFNTPHLSANVIEQPGVPHQSDPTQTISAVKWRPDRQPLRTSQHNRKTECFYCQHWLESPEMRAQ